MAYNKFKITWSEEYTTNGQRKALRNISAYDIQRYFDYIPPITLTFASKPRWNGSRCGFCKFFTECNEFKSVKSDSPYCHRVEEDRKFTPRRKKMMIGKEVMVRESIHSAYAGMQGVVVDRPFRVMELGMSRRVKEEPGVSWVKLFKYPEAPRRFLDTELLEREEPCQT